MAVVSTSAGSDDAEDVARFVADCRRTFSPSSAVGLGKFGSKSDMFACDSELNDDASSAVFDGGIQFDVFNTCASAGRGNCLCKEASVAGIAPVVDLLSGDRKL